MNTRAALGIAVIAFFLFSCHGTRPDVVGRGFGQLAPCPSSPNCISTAAADSTHRMDPIRYQGSAQDAMQRLVAVVKSMPRTRIVQQTDTYLYVEFMSKVWRFVDDVEFTLDDSAKVINFRSASRLGYSDMGVNRARMAEVTATFAAGRQ